MKIRKNARKSLLAAFVCLALSAGTAWAMPTGGTVVVGGTNVDISDPSNITVNANGLVDWDSFSIGANETVNFAFGGGGGWQIINHVTGSQLSQLLGTLSATGNGHVMLINPNGITVGGGAHIDVGSLTLSTLNATDEALTSYLNGSPLNLTGNASSKLKIESGADIKFGEMLQLFGGKIEIADGVTISNGSEHRGQGIIDDEDTYAAVLAGNRVRPAEKGGEQEISAVADNTLLVGADFKNDRNTSLDMDWWGGNVTLNNASIQGTGEGQSEITLAAGNYISREGFTDEGDELTITGTSANKLTLNDTVITTDDNIQLLAGAVEVKDSALTVNAKKKDNDYIAAYAGNKIFFEPDKNNYPPNQLMAGNGNTLTIDNSSLSVTKVSGNAKAIDLAAGGIVVKNGTSANADGMIDMYGTKSVTVSGSALSGGAEVNLRSIGNVKIDNSTVESQGLLYIPVTQSIAYKDTGTEFTTGSSNVIEILNNSKLYGKDKIELRAGKVKVDSSDLQGGRRIIMDIGAKYQGVKADGKEIANTIWSTENNSVTVNNSKLTVLKEDVDIDISAGKVNISDTVINSPGVHMVAAGKYYYSDKEEMGVIQNSGIGNSLTLNNVRHTVPGGESEGELIALAGSIDIKGATSFSPNSNVYLGAGKSLTLKFDGEGKGSFVGGVSGTGNLISLSREAQASLDSLNPGRAYYIVTDGSNSQETVKETLQEEGVLQRVTRSLDSDTNVNSIAENAGLEVPGTTVAASPINNLGSSSETADAAAGVSIGGNDTGKADGVGREDKSSSDRPDSTDNERTTDNSEDEQG